MHLHTPSASTNKRPNPSTPEESRTRPHSSYHSTLSQSPSPSSWSWAQRRSPPLPQTTSPSNHPLSPSSTDSRLISTISTGSPKPKSPGRESWSNSIFGNFQGIEPGSGSRLPVQSVRSMGSGASMLFPRDDWKDEGPVLSPVTPQRTTPGVLTSPTLSPATLTTATTTTTPSITTTTTITTGMDIQIRRPTRVKIKIRDFAFENLDDRYRGMGTDVPKPNRFARLNKKLGGSKKARPTSRRWSITSDSVDSAASSNISDDNEEDPKERIRFRVRGRFLDDDDDDDDDDWTF